MKCSWLLLLFLSACILPDVLDHHPAAEMPGCRVAGSDTLHLTAFELVHAKKIKNRGVIIIQAGASNVAGVVEKAKSPVSVGQTAAATSTTPKPGILDQLKRYGVGLVVGALALVGLLFYLKRS